MRTIKISVRLFFDLTDSSLTTSFFFRSTGAHGDRARGWRQSGVHTHHTPEAEPELMEVAATEGFLNLGTTVLQCVHRSSGFEVLVASTNPVQLQSLSLSSSSLWQVLPAVSYISLQVTV
jgi:hypothetical protein